MRLAEDMLLNAKVYQLTPYARCDEHNRRCALGLVETYRSGWFCWPVDGTRAEAKYPWLDEVNYAVPCECLFPADDQYRTQLPCMVAHLFNEHVMQGGHVKPGAKPWTIERLADWIDSIDPTPRETAAEQSTADLQTLLEAVHERA